MLMEHTTHQMVLLKDNVSRDIMTYGDGATHRTKAVALRENYFRQNPETGGKVRALHIKYVYANCQSRSTGILIFYLPFTKKWSERVTKASSDSKLVLSMEAIPNEVRCGKSFRFISSGRFH